MGGLGMTTGFERLHYLLESAFDADGHLSITFLKVTAGLNDTWHDCRSHSVKNELSECCSSCDP